MAEFEWSDGATMTQAEEHVIRSLANGDENPLSVAAVDHLVALLVVKRADDYLDMRLTGLGCAIATQYLGVQIKAAFP